MEYETHEEQFALFQKRRDFPNRLEGIQLQVAKKYVLKTKQIE
jgi:hypothetical protein